MTKYTEAALREWIEMGYFTSHDHLIDHAFKIIREAVSILQKEKVVVSFDDVVVTVSIDVTDQTLARKLN